MRLNKKIISIVVLALVLITSVPVFAALESDVTISLGSDYSWNKRQALTRSGSYNDVTARCHSVYPSSGNDNFEKIRVCIENTAGTRIMDSSYVTLNETSSSSTSIPIKQGYLDTDSVVFKFCGNTEKAASAVVSYNAR